jgi:hypothetical protein
VREGRHGSSVVSSLKWWMGGSRLGARGNLVGEDATLLFGLDRGRRHLVYFFLRCFNGLPPYLLSGIC